MPDHEDLVGSFKRIEGTYLKYEDLSEVISMSDVAFLVCSFVNHVMGVRRLNWHGVFRPVSIGVKYLKHLMNNSQCFRRHPRFG